MKPEELRKGNCVGATLAGHTNPITHPDYIGNGQVLHIIEFGKDIDNAHWYFSIPLTEEWLIKFRFLKEAEHEYFIDAWSKGHPSARFEIEYRNNGVLLKSRYQSSDDNLKMRHIKYVHQLQNLYFALTGEELKLNK